MSIKVQSYVWEHSKAKGSALLLLLAIADHAHDDGTGAWPSVDHLADKCRQSARNVQTLLRKLEAMGELQTATGEGPHGCNAYIIPMGGENFSGVKSSAPGVKTSAKKIRQISPEPSGTISKPSYSESRTDSPPPSSKEELPARQCSPAKSERLASVQSACVDFARRTESPDLSSARSEAISSPRAVKAETDEIAEDIVTLAHGEPVPLKCVPSSERGTAKHLATEKLRDIRNGVLTRDQWRKAVSDLHNGSGGELIDKKGEHITNLFDVVRVVDCHIRGGMRPSVGAVNQMEQLA